jgi:hypothetical protein
VTHKVRVIIESDNGLCRVDAIGLCADNGVRDIERGDRAVESPQETVEPEVCVKVNSRNFPRRVDARRIR